VRFLWLDHAAHSAGIFVSSRHFLGAGIEQAGNAQSRFSHVRLIERFCFQAK
jgi:hypothetical protein